MNNISQNITNIRLQNDVKTKTLYHRSSSNEIDKFKEPAFFTNNKSYAQWFAQKKGGSVYEVHLKIEKTFF